MADNERLYPLNPVKLSGTTKSWAETLNANFAEIDERKTDIGDTTTLVHDANYVHTDNNYTTAEKNKLAGVQAGATKVEASTTNGKIKINGTETTVYTLPSDVVQDASYVHTDSNFTADEKTKLAGVATGAQANVLEGVQLNGTDLAITNKKVNVQAVTSVGATSGSGIAIGGTTTAPTVGIASTHKLPTTIEYNDLATKDYVDTNGGKIDVIQANGTPLAISNKTVNITAADLGLSSALKFIGVTTTALSDGATTNPIVVGGNSVTATSGNVVIYGNKEFIWNGGAATPSWEELGDEASWAMKSVTITGTGALGGGGSLEANRTITHNAGSEPSKASGFYKFSTDAYSHIASTTPVAKDDLTDLIGYPAKAQYGADFSLVTTGDKYFWDAKQEALATQTIYQNAGESDRIPQITTNSLGQVTNINLLEIDYPIRGVSIYNNHVDVDVNGYADLGSVVTDITRKVGERNQTFIVSSGTDTSPQPLYAFTTTDTTYGVVAKPNSIGKFYEGQKLRSIQFDTSKAAELESWLKSLTYTETGMYGTKYSPLVVTFDANQTLEEGSMLYAMDATNVNLGYGIILNFLGQNVVLFGTQSGATDDLNWNAGFNNLDENGALVFAGYNIIEAVADGDWNGTLIGYQVGEGGYDGLISVSDKQKLDGVSAGATKVEKSSTNGNIKIDGVETTVFTMPSVDQKVVYSFTANDANWSSAVNGIYTLTIASTKYPINVFNSDNKVVMATLGVNKSGDAVSAITVESDEKFAGYVVAL